MFPLSLKGNFRRRSRVLKDANVVAARIPRYFCVSLQLILLTFTSGIHIAFRYILRVVVD